MLRFVSRSGGLRYGNASHYPGHTPSQPDFDARSHCRSDGHEATYVYAEPLSSDQADGAPHCDTHSHGHGCTDLCTDGDTDIGPPSDRYIASHLHARAYVDSDGNTHVGSDTRQTAHREFGALRS